MAIKYRWLAQQLRKKVYDNMEKGVPRLPSEQDLCRHYGVSRQTVRQSLALLEQEGLITRKQGSGSFITGLTSGRNAVGLLLADDQDSYRAALLEEIRQSLPQKGFTANVYLTGNRICAEHAILSELLETPPRGLLVEGVKSALPNPNLDLYRQLHSMGVPAVFLRGSYGALPQAPCIREDDTAGTALLTAHLLHQGHRDVGAVFQLDDAQGQRRFQGFAETLRGAGLPVRDEQICWYVTEDLEPSYSAPYGFLLRMAQTRLQGCTAVVCQNGDVAYWLSRLLPDTVMASCEDTCAGTGNLLPFTALERRPRELGKAAVQAITDRLRGLPAYSRELPLKLAVRDGDRLPSATP